MRKKDDIIEAIVKKTSELFGDDFVLMADIKEDCEDES